jgi:hypothetical protein
MSAAKGDGTGKRSYDLRNLSVIIIAMVVVALAVMMLGGRLTGEVALDTSQTYHMSESVVLDYGLYAFDVGEGLPAIEISSDDVVLDCAGATIAGSGAGIGIVNDGHDNVTIKDCFVQGFEFGLNSSGETDYSSSTFVANIVENIYSPPAAESQEVVEPGRVISTAQVEVPDGLNVDLVVDSSADVVQNIEGMIKFSEDVPMSGISSCVILGDNLVGIKDTYECRLFDRPAELHIRELSFRNVPVVLRDGVYCPEPDCVITAYDGSTLVFNVSGFSNYSAGSNSQLFIYDDNDGLSTQRGVNTLINFTANYSKLSDSTPINTTEFGVNCTIVFDTVSSRGFGPFNMSYVTAKNAYYFNTSFYSVSSVGWNVSCVANSTYDPLNGSDSISVVPHCGDTIRESFTMTEDLRNATNGTICKGRGLVISNLLYGAATLDCAGFMINGSNAAGFVGIKVMAGNVVVKNCSLFNFTTETNYEGSIAVLDVNNVSIIGNYIFTRSSGAYGIQFRNSNYSLIENNTVRTVNTGVGDGIYVRGSDFLNLRNNYVYTNIGGGLYFASTKSTNVDVSGNYFYSYNGMKIYSAFDNLSIRSNFFNNSYKAIETAANPSTGLLIRDNVVRFTGGPALSFSDPNSGLSYVDIINNSIVSDEQGISLKNAQFVNMMNNSIIIIRPSSGSTYGGIVMSEYCSNVTIANNLMNISSGPSSNSGDAAIYCRHDFTRGTHKYLRVLNNTIFGNTSVAGIYLRACNSSYFDGNSINVTSLPFELDVQSRFDADMNITLENFDRNGRRVRYVFGEDQYISEKYGAQLLVYYSKNITFNDSDFLNSANLVVSDSEDIRFFDSNFSTSLPDTGSTYYQFAHLDNASGVLFERVNLLVNGTGTYFGIYAEPYSGNLSILDSNISLQRYSGAAVYLLDLYGSPVNLLGNYLYSNYSSIVTLHSLTSFNISNNNIVGSSLLSGDSIYIYGGGNGTISGNAIRNRGTSGDGIFVDPNSRLENIIISGNSINISGSSATGLTLQMLYNSTVSLNQVNSTGGILFKSGGNVTFRDNSLNSIFRFYTGPFVSVDVVNNSFAGYLSLDTISSVSNGIRILNNNINTSSSPGYAGITVSSANINNISVESNVINVSYSPGISCVAGKNFSIVDNYIIGGKNTGDGFIDISGCVGGFVDGNTVNATYGVPFEVGTKTASPDVFRLLNITENNFDSYGRSIIYVTGGNVSVSGKDGAQLLIFYADNVTVDDSVFYNASNVVIFNSSDVLISDSNFSGNVTYNMALDYTSFMDFSADNGVVLDNVEIVGGGANALCIKVGDNTYPTSDFVLRDSNVSWRFSSGICLDLFGNASIQGSYVYNANDTAIRTLYTKKSVFLLNSSQVYGGEYGLDLEYLSSFSLLDSNISGGGYPYYAVSTVTCGNGTFNNLEIRPIYGGLSVWCPESNVSNVRIYDSPGKSFELYTSTTNFRNRVYNLSVFNSRGSGVYIRGSASNSSLENIFVYGSGIGIEFDYWDTTRDINFTNVVIQTNGTGIYFGKNNNSIFDDVVINVSGRGTDINVSSAFVNRVAYFNNATIVSPRFNASSPAYSLFFTNSSLDDSAASVFYPEFNISNRNDTRLYERLNLSVYNRVYINSSDLGFLNRSATIRFKDIDTSSGVPSVLFSASDDLNNPSGWVDCDISRCTGSPAVVAPGVVEVNVSSFTIYALDLATAPTHSNPVLNSSDGLNISRSNLTVYNRSTSDVNGDVVKNIISWKVNNRPIMVLNMPFENWGSNGTHNVGNISVDYSGFGNNGTVNGSFWNSTGGFDGFGAYEFDGVDDAVDIGNPSSLNLVANFSVEAWIKADSLPGFGIYPRIISKLSAAPYYGYELVLGSSDYGNKVYLQLANNGVKAATNSNSALSVGVWTHVVGTYNGTHSAIYINGVRQSDVDAVSDAVGVTSYGLKMGGWPGGGRHFDGTIDEVRIYNRSLSAQQILALYENKSDTIVSQELRVGDVWVARVTPNDGYFDGVSLDSNSISIRVPPNTLPTHSVPIINSSFGNNISTENITVYNQSTFDADGDRVKNIVDWRKAGRSVAVLNMPFEADGRLNTSDYSMRLNNGTVSGVVWNSTGGFDGRGAFMFNGGGQINTPLSVGIANGASPVSICAWIRPNSVSGTPTLIHMGSPTDNSSYLTFIRDGKAVFDMWNNQITTSSAVFSNNVWTHYCAVYSSGNFNTSNIYINGNVVTSFYMIGFAGDSPPHYVDSVARIGYRKDNQYPFSGTIDDVLIFNRSLSADEVRALYENKTHMVLDDALSGGDKWSACVTPNDGFGDGLTECSVDLTVAAAPAPNVTLVGPLNASLQNYSVNFSCNASAGLGASLSRIDLYHNGSGVFSLVASRGVSGSSAQVNFTVPVVRSGISVWNCFAVDGYGSVGFAADNFSVNVTNCPVISEPGTQFVMRSGYLGAPNDIGAIMPLSSACVKITASDVSFDCGGFNITGNNNTPSAPTVGIVLNGSLNNVSVRNCGMVGGYSYGALVYRSNRSSFSGLNFSDIFDYDVVLNSSSGGVFSSIRSDGLSDWSLYSDSGSVNNTFDGLVLGSLRTSFVSKDVTLKKTVAPSGSQGYSPPLPSVEIHVSSTNAGTMVTGVSEARTSLFYDIMARNRTTVQYSGGFNYTFNSSGVPSNGSLGVSLSVITSPTSLSLTDDSVSGVLQLPFNVSLYGRNMSNLRVCSNGFIYLNETVSLSSYTTYTPLDLATLNIVDSYGAAAFIAGVWTDLYPPGKGTVTYGTNGVAPNRVFIVYFNDVSQCCDSIGGNTFQIKLFENGTSGIAVAGAQVSDPVGYYNISKFLEIRNTSQDSGIMLNVSYDASDVVEVSESSLIIAEFNGSGWVTDQALFANYHGVDTVLNTVFANITNFSSIFGVFGQPLSASPLVSCVDLYNYSTWSGKINNISNRSFFVNSNITLCSKTYVTDTIHDFLMMNGSYSFDCDGSRIVGGGLGTGLLSRFNDTVVKNCVFENFGTGINILDINRSSVPSVAWNWSQNPSSSLAGLLSLVVDQSGYYVAGGYDTSPGDVQWAVVKLSPDGVTLWNWTENPSGSDDYVVDVVVDQGGNYVVAGYNTSDDVDYEWRIVKIASNGTTLWNWSQNPTPDEDEIVSVAVDRDGNYVAAGYDLISGSDYRWRVVKLSPDGVTLWNWTLNMSYGWKSAQSVAVDADGDYIVAGFNTSGSDNGWYVVKLSSDGVALWNWSQNPSDAVEFIFSVAVDKEGNYVVGGDDQSQAPFSQLRVVKLSHDGVALWDWIQNPSSGYDAVRSVAVDQFGDYVLAGVDYIPGNLELRVVKLSSDGVALWNWTQNPSGSNDYAVSVDTDDAGDLLLAGLDQSSGYNSLRVVKLSPPKNVMSGVLLSNVTVLDSDVGTFVALPNASATTTNFTVGYNSSVGLLNYLGISGASGVLSGANLLVRPGFVSLDSSDARTISFNVSANMTVQTESGACSGLLYKKLSGFPQDASIIRLSGVEFTPDYSSCSAGVSRFSTFNAFSGYSIESPPPYSGCVDLYDSSTWSGRIYDVSNRSFFVNNNITLCKKNYSTDTIHDFLIVNGSYSVDCNFSRLVGGGLGTGLLSRFNDTVVKNCVFENFGTGINILDINRSSVPVVAWNWTSDNFIYGSVARSVVVDADGDYIVVGTASDGSNQFLQAYKFAANGSVLWGWSQDLPGSVDELFSVDVDQEGDYFVAGRYSSGGVKLRVAKVSHDGLTLWNWTQALSASYLSSTTFDVSVSQDGGFVVGGGDLVSSGDTVMRVFKVSGNGSDLWNWTGNLSTSYEDVTSVAVDQAGDYVVVGRAFGQSNWSVVKFSSGGSVLWNWTQTPPGSTEPKSVAVDHEGNYVVAGYFYYSGSYAWRVVKIASNGSTLWNWTQNPSSSHEKAYSVAVDMFGDYVVVGSEFISGDISEDWRVVKISSDGETLWNWTQKPSVYSDEAFSVAVDRFGDAVVVGSESYPNSSRRWRVVKLSPPKNLMSGVSITDVTVLDSNMSTFVALPDASATITNLTIGYNSSVGLLNYLGISGASGVLSGANLFVRPDFVSLDSSDVRTQSFNVSANITIQTESGACSDLSYRKLSGFPQDAAIIRSSGVEFTPSYSSCVGGVSRFSTFDAFSGYSVAYALPSVGCVDLYDSSTWSGRIYDVSNRSFFVNSNITLCSRTYSTDTIHDFIILNGSYSVDCNFSRLVGGGLGSGLLSVFNDTVVKNCQFENFSTGLSVFDVDETSVPIAVWNWSNNPTADRDRLYSVAVDGAGDYVVAGYIDSAVGYGWRVLKFSSDGSYLWNWSGDPSVFTGLAKSVAVDRDDNYVVTGSSSDNSLRLVKIGADGSTIWNWSQSSVSPYAPQSVAVDRAGNIFVGGAWGSFPDYTWSVVKVSPDGVSLWNWSQNPSLNNDQVYFIAVDQAGDVFAAGHEYYSATDYGWRVVKISSEGVTLWNWTSNPGSAFEAARSLAVDRFGDVFVVGDNRSGIVQWSGVKISGDGSVLWNWNYDPSSGFDVPLSVDVSSDGTFVVGGDRFTAGSAYDWHVVGVSSDGLELWNWSREIAVGEDFLNSISVDQGGDIVAAGHEVVSSSDYHWHVAKLSVPKNLMSGVSISNVTVLDSNVSTFVALPDASATITNLTVGYNSSVGLINYLGVAGVSGVLSGANLFVRPDFVSLDSSDVRARSFNVSANITIQTQGGGCADLFYMKLSGFPENASIIRSSGVEFAPSYSSCVGGVSRFSTFGAFSGYSTSVDTSAPFVSLVSPQDGAVLDVSDFNLSCNVTDTALKNISLYHNISGVFRLNQSMDISGTFNFTNFSLSGVPDTYFVWNCLGFDEVNNSAFASNNFSLYVSTVPEFNLTLYIDGVESSVFAQTALPYTVTVNVKADGVDYAGGDVVIFEQQGNNIFIPLRQSGVVSEAVSSGVTDSHGNITFIVAPTHYPANLGYAIGAGVLYGGDIVATKNFSITNNGSISFVKKAVSPGVLGDNAKVAVNAMNSIINSLYLWANDVKEANQVSMTVFTNGTVVGGGTVQTGAPNVLNITLKDGLGVEVSGLVKVEEDSGYLLFDPTDRPPVVGSKNHSHRYGYVGTSSKFVVTPTSYGAVSSQVNVSVFFSNLTKIREVNLSLYADLEPRSGTAYDDDAMKVIINSMNSVVNSLYYALN